MPVPWEIAAILQAGSISKGYMALHDEKYCKDVTDYVHKLLSNLLLQVKESECFTCLGLETEMLFYGLTLSGKGRMKSV